MIKKRVMILFISLIIALGCSELSYANDSTITKEVGITFVDQSDQGQENGTNNEGDSDKGKNEDGKLPQTGDSSSYGITASGAVMLIIYLVLINKNSKKGTKSNKS